MKTTEEPIVVEQTFYVSPDTVWQAITEHERMLRWFFEEIPEFQAEVGFETMFDVECDGRVFPHLWKIVEVVPGEKIVYDWAYAGYDGRAKVSFEVAQKGMDSKLTVSCVVTEDFPDGIPEFTHEACLDGWTYFINQNLKEYLEN